MTAEPALIVRRFVGGPLLTVCYALIAPGRETFLIDIPRDAWRGALELADSMGAPVTLVLASHGHWDHITDLSKINALGIPVAAHPGDRELFDDPMGRQAGQPFVIEPARIDQELADGDRLAIGDEELQVLHTPGHTWGSISLWAPAIDALFTGDTVLKGGAGYLEQPESSDVALAASVRRIAAFPEATTLYPGHGAPTTVGQETWLADATDPELLIEHWHSGLQRWTPRGAM